MANPLTHTTAPDTIISQPETQEQSRRVTARTATAAALLALSLGTGGQEAQSAPATPMTAESNTIVLAQATTQETDGKIYTAEVIQVDGSKKVVKYFRDLEGVIIPPTIVDGKLVDGSDAPSDPMRAKIAQKKILVKYDKNAQIMLALVSKDDIIRKADGDLDKLIKLANDDRLISKGDIYTAFYSLYILRNAGAKGVESMKGIETIAKIKVKLTDSEISSIKKDAELKALQIWRSTTGAVA